MKTKLLLPAGLFAVLTLQANIIDTKTALGDTTMPQADDISQTFPYGVSSKTPPVLKKINFKGQASFHKHRINLRVFQSCPHIEVSDGGRLWATWFGSNVQSERASRVGSDSIPRYHEDQFSVIATSGDDGRTWKEVFVFDPSDVLGGSASDPMLWKDANGRIRFVGLRNMYLGGNQDVTTAWEFTMEDPENEFTGWSAPRLLGNKNMSIMKPLLMPDGGILRPMDDFKKRKAEVPAPRIGFVREDAAGNVLFVSGFADAEANFAEQMPIIRKDGSLFTFYRTTGSGQKFAESFDGGKTWKRGGFYPMQFSVDTKCFLKKLDSGRVLLIANDVQVRKDGDKPYYYYTDENGKEVRSKSGARSRMTAFLSEDDGKTFPHKLLLKGDGKLSYPSASVGKNGFIYIVYDQGRGTVGQHFIWLSKITEADILAGKLVNEESRLNDKVSSPSEQGGGRRKGDKI